MTVAGKGGRPKNPTNLKLLQGERSDRINSDEPKPDTADIVKPDWLPEAAAAVWDRLAPDLIRKHVLTAWDVDSFATFCAAVVINREALQEIDETGVKCTTVVRELASGDIIYDLRRNPAWQVARESAQVMTSIGGRFGLTPADRAGLSIPKAGDGNSNADLFTS